MKNQKNEIKKIKIEKDVFDCLISLSFDILMKYKMLHNNQLKAIMEIRQLISNCDISDYQGEKIINILKGEKND